MVATKELFQEAMPMIDCFDYSWSIVSDPQKAEQIENSLSAIISSGRFRHGLSGRGADRRQGAAFYFGVLS